uniref:Uncharacterized protein n=1 Tax=Palpitomonas bilix TaxID=652834 RepID=A0A7S3GLE4_9EUKA|mmetsp:Transcript_8311/g.22072  ORF Transcript_8311/g.22072 Transcript_8311/m.22072 type:complete len:452 (+) Transcript_8311:607-1962(+)
MDSAGELGSSGGDWDEPSPRRGETGTVGSRGGGGRLKKPKVRKPKKVDEKWGRSGEPLLLVSDALNTLAVDEEEETRKSVERAMAERRGKKDVVDVRQALPLPSTFFLEETTPPPVNDSISSLCVLPILRQSESPMLLSWNSNAGVEASTQALPVPAPPPPTSDAEVMTDKVAGEEEWRRSNGRSRRDSATNVEIPPPSPPPAVVEARPPRRGSATMSTQAGVESAEKQVHVGQEMRVSASQTISKQVHDMSMNTEGDVEAKTSEKMVDIRDVLRHGFKFDRLQNRGEVNPHLYLGVCDYVDDFSDMIDEYKAKAMQKQQKQDNEKKEKEEGRREVDAYIQAQLRAKREEGGRGEGEKGGEKDETEEGEEESKTKRGGDGEEVEDEEEERPHSMLPIPQRYDGDVEEEGGGRSSPTELSERKPVVRADQRYREFGADEIKQRMFRMRQKLE